MSNSAVFEILAQFELVITHEFSVDDREEAEDDVSAMLEIFEDEVQQIFSDSTIDIQLDNDSNLHSKPISKSSAKSKQEYRFTGSLKRCYLFAAKDFEDDELIDGTFEVQLSDMKLAVSSCCEMLDYETTLTSFSWADDEFVEDITE